MFGWFRKQREQQELINSLALMFEQVDSRQVALLHKLVHAGLLSSSDAIRLAAIETNEDAMRFVSDEIRSAYAHETTEEGGPVHGSTKETNL